MTHSPRRTPPPIVLLTRAAETIDERLLTLLAALGPAAVAADPGLPLRLLHKAPALPRLSAPQRRLLGLRLAPADSDPAQGTGTNNGGNNGVMLATSIVLGAPASSRPGDARAGSAGFQPALGTNSP